MLYSTPCIRGEFEFALLGKIQKSLAPRLAGMRPGECELVLSGV